MQISQELFKVGLGQGRARPDNVLGLGPLTSFGKILGVTALLARLIESVLDAHDRRGKEEVREENDEDHGPHDCEAEAWSHETHGILLPHHCDDLHLGATNQGRVFAEVGTHEHVGQESEAELNGDQEHQKQGCHIEGLIDD